MKKPAIETTTTWNKNLEVGAKLEGFYTKFEVVDSNYGESNKYVIETKDGKKFGVFGSTTLDRQFKNIPEGCYVWIEYKGEETSAKTGRPVKIYEVSYDDEIVKQ